MTRPQHGRARAYFGARGAREPLPTALVMTALVMTVIVMVLDAVIVAGLLARSFAMFASVAGTWLPFVLIFLATWITGQVRSTMPWPKSADRGAPRGAGEAGAPAGA